MKRYTHLSDTYSTTALRLVVLLLFLQLGRWWFYLYNRDLLGAIPFGELLTIGWGGLRFDLAAAVLLTLPWLLLRILPFDFVYGRRYTLLTDTLYALGGSAGLVANLCDTPYYRFTGMRTQALHLSEIFQDEATADVLGAHLRSHAGLALAGAGFIALFLFVAFRFRAVPPARRRMQRRCTAAVVALAAIFFAMRGSFDFRVHPLQLTDAHAYCSANNRTALVLNTPFSVLRTVGKDFSLKPYAFFTPEELAARRPDRHTASGTVTARGARTDAGSDADARTKKGDAALRANDTAGNDAALRAEVAAGNDAAAKTAAGTDAIAGEARFTRRNVVQIILEGCGDTFIGALNPFAAEEPIADRSLTPFLDSLAAQSLLFTDFYTHLRKSSAGITAILGGIPAYSPFLYMLSPYRDNEVETLASLLGDEGYASAFFCGCNKGSFAFAGMSEAFGYDRFFDRTDYEAIRGGGDYDGQWGIFDHAMAAHLLHELNTMPEPFLVSWFTLNTHNPFTIPEAYRAAVRSPRGTMHGTVEYIDRVLRDFFAAAAREPWFARTLFVITADHGHAAGRPLYDNPAQLNRIPLLLYTPDGSIAARRSDRVGGQIDIAPTILDALHYPKPWFSLGSSLLNEIGGGTCLFDDQTDLRWVEGDRMLRIDKERLTPIALYDHRRDPLLTTDLAPREPERVARMLDGARALLQDQRARLIENRLKSDE